VPHRGLQTRTVALDLRRGGFIGVADGQLQQLRIIGNGARGAVDLLDVAG
jgi:hypothetical protein